MCTMNSAESSAKKASWTSVKVGNSEVNILKSVGERTAPRGTPERTPHSANLSPATETHSQSTAFRPQKITATFR
jgi:hypothetical protein